MAIIPVGYIQTNEAVEELVGADPHHQRLRAEWLSAIGEAKAKAYIDVGERQNQLTDRLFEAVKSGKLVAVALKRMRPSGEWVEHGIPARYLETMGGDLAFWTGSVERLGLEPGDRWIADAPLCFRRSDFDDWLAGMIVLRPLGAEDLPTWWTVPEAAVWIATRDLSKVRALDAGARAWLMVADEVVPGAYKASFELLAGLRDGRLLASGRHPGRQAAGVGERVQPNYWQAPTEFSDGKIGVEAVRGLGDVMVGLLLESDDVMTCWESPQSLLDGEKIPLGEAIGRLMHESLSAYLLHHREVCVTGLNARGERVEIDKDVFQTNATIDRCNHAVATADRRLHWSAVMVELRAKPEPTLAQPAEDDRERSMALSTSSPSAELEYPQPSPKAKPSPYVSEEEALTWLKEVIARVVADGRQLRRGDFDALLRQQYKERLAPKMEDRLWQLAAPEDWRRANQGRLPDKKVVHDWRSYLGPPAIKRG